MKMFAHEFVSLSLCVCVCVCVCVGHSLFGDVHLNDALQGVNVCECECMCVSALGC